MPADHVIAGGNLYPKYSVRNPIARRLVDGFLTALAALAPSDIERILFGRLHSAQLHPGRDGPLGPEGRRLVGPLGFVLE